MDGNLSRKGITADLESMKEVGLGNLVFLEVNVGSLEQSERFLWDVRLTSQELVLENHAGYLKELGHKHGLELSISELFCDFSPQGFIKVGGNGKRCEFSHCNTGDNPS